MNDVKLKIKAKSLAEESKIIRREENKLQKKPEYMSDKDRYLLSSLAYHRRWDVRNESRATGLARAFLKGLPYSVVEYNCKDKHRRDLYIVPRVVTMANKYKQLGDRTKFDKDAVLAWMNA